MSESFKLSDDFAAFEAENAMAAEEAGKAEKMVMGINVPMGTVGAASILSMEAGKSKVKVDEKTKQQTGGHPMITLTLLVDTPEQYRGQKIPRWFTFNATANQTVVQKYQRFYDFLEDCGMPKEMRGKPMAEIAKWALGETRNFNYEIIPLWSDPKQKDFKPTAPAGPLPGATDIEAAMSATFTPGSPAVCAGNPCEVVSITGDQAKIKFANGQEMQVAVAQLTPPA